MLKRVCIFLLLAILLASCETRGKTYRIGVDPSYYPAPLGGKEANVYAFSKNIPPHTQGKTSRYSLLRKYLSRNPL